MKKYQIIYADPPWEYDSSRSIKIKSCLSGDNQYHYPYMPIEQICALPIKRIIDIDSSLLFLWVTSPKLNLAFQVIESWGFNYSTVAFVWEKIKISPGYYTLSSIEFCLVSRCGNIPQPRGRRNVRQFFQEERTEHSKKPDGIRNLITEMFPTQRKVELFARERIKGWDVWGNEIKSNIKLVKRKLND